MLATAYSPEQWALAGSTALGAIGAFIAVIISAKQGRQNGQGIGQVHELVNDASTKAANRIEQLGASLQDAGIDVPPREPNGR